MIKKYKNFINYTFFIIVFLCLFCFFLNAETSFALEAKYPTLNTAAGAVGLDEGDTLPQYIVYLFWGGMFVGFSAVFLGFLIGGIMFILSPVNVEMRANAKDRITGAISGLLILTLVYLILSTINPQLVGLKLDPLSKISDPPAKPKDPGVYFFDKTGCPFGNVSPHISGVKDLENLKNKVKSVALVKGSESAYISVLYDLPNYRGKCQYLDPNAECQTVNPFATSATVYEYDFEPNGGGVYIFRKSFFNEKGGYFYISNEDIAAEGYFESSLDKLKFIDDNCRSQDNPNGCCVPKDEQDCIKYEKNGQCAKDGRTCPTLAGENISSIAINGNYFILLTYAGPGQTCESMELDFCQAFPTVDDKNGIGPAQIKWEQIRNNKNIVPNCITIVPVK